jgi:hypothetical protein
MIQASMVAALFFAPSALAAPLNLTATTMHPSAVGVFSVDGDTDPLPEGVAVWFMKGDGEGPGPCPAYLDGACWGITAPRFVQVGWTSAGGVADWSYLVAAGALGATASFQAAVNDPEGSFRPRRAPSPSPSRRPPVRPHGVSTQRPRRPRPRRWPPLLRSSRPSQGHPTP